MMGSAGGPGGKGGCFFENSVLGQKKRGRKIQRRVTGGPLEVNADLTPTALIRGQSVDDGSREA